MCFKPLQSVSLCAHVTAGFPPPPCLYMLLYSVLDLSWSPRPQAVGPVHQLQLLGETTGEPGPFGGPNNNMNGRAEGQEAQPDMPVLRKALFSKEKKKQWQSLFQPKTPRWLPSRQQHNTITFEHLDNSRELQLQDDPASLFLQWKTGAERSARNDFNCLARL